MDRIKETSTIQEGIAAMSDGNPGALTAMMEIMTSDHIHPDNVLGGYSAIMRLDTWEIYGTDIYVFWSDICGKDTTKMMAVIRACQMGYFNPVILKDACSRQDYSGKDLVPVEALYEKIKFALPNFDKKIET